MRYRALLTGNNRTIINEFFTYMDFIFECINTSERYDDIMNHLKYIQPDVFVYCIYGEKPDDMKRFANVQRKIAEQEIPLVVIGEAEDCEQFALVAPHLEPLVLRRPITAQKISLSISEMLEDRKKKQERETARLRRQEEAERARRLLEEAARKEEAIEAAKEAEGERRKHILVIDDDSSILKLLKGYLAERYDVATAISGKVAMKFLETKETDLVLLDYEMPVENGSVVFGKIRSMEKTKDLPVVFLTGVTEKSKITEVLSMKPQGYLLKPVDMEKLSSTIKGILG
ncbi:MAG: response regulator [Lachnospiraceae bacterium]|jgi:DNA-binding NtrC family response regulator|nr:response regulator [Lachnospiraceae bacterium]